MVAADTRVSVLVVEDEPLLLLSIADDLRDAGYKVLEANNADAAIRLLEANQDISILFTDIDMPGSMDGLKLSEAVRNRWPPVQIIVTSGHMNLSDKDLPVAGRFVPKPYSPATIVSTIRDFMG
jgi:CheY-like chemotaxis protein